MSTVIKVNEAEVFSASPVSKSPDSKIPILSAAKRRQKVTKLDLLARNEAVRNIFVSEGLRVIRKDYEHL